MRLSLPQVETWNNKGTSDLLRDRETGSLQPAEQGGRRADRKARQRRPGDLRAGDVGREVRWLGGHGEKGQEREAGSDQHLGEGHRRRLSFAWVKVASARSQVQSIVLVGFISQAYGEPAGQSARSVRRSRAQLPRPGGAHSRKAVARSDQVAKLGPGSSVAPLATSGMTSLGEAASSRPRAELADCRTGNCADPSQKLIAVNAVQLRSLNAFGENSSHDVPRANVSPQEPAGAH